jgi:hypothetical protein
MLLNATLPYSIIQKWMYIMGLHLEKHKCEICTHNNNLYCKVFTVRGACG